jgi:ATP adenylyltransferase
MDYLWSPWRYHYVSSAGQQSGCIFCEFPRNPADEENLILHRAELNFVLLNRFPYTTGHLMVVPYAHVADLAGTPHEALAEMIALAQRAERALRAEYKPDGFNAGFNIGECAGAGVAGHLHLHVLPRWYADSNFMTVVGETRVLPEDLDATYRKLKPYFAARD